MIKSNFLQNLLLSYLKWRSEHIQKQSIVSRVSDSFCDPLKRSRTVFFLLTLFFSVIIIYFIVLSFLIKTSYLILVFLSLVLSLPLCILFFIKDKRHEILNKSFLRLDTGSYYDEFRKWLKDNQYDSKLKIKQLRNRCLKYIGNQETIKRNAYIVINGCITLAFKPLSDMLMHLTANYLYIFVIIVCLYVEVNLGTHLIFRYSFSYLRHLQSMVDDIQDTLDRCFPIYEDDLV